MKGSDEVSSSYFQCVAYTDVESTVRVEENVIYVKIDAANTSVHLTFNLAQILIFVQSLNLALSKIPVAEINEDDNYGNMTVEITVQAEAPDDDKVIANIA